MGFSALAGLASLRGGRVDAVIAMSPPLTMGLTGWGTHLVRRGPLIFNIQDVFPDAAVETGAISNKAIIAVARWLERISYHRAAAVTVLSGDLRDNVAAKVRPSKRDDIRVIPNFVDTDFIRPQDRMTATAPRARHRVADRRAVRRQRRLLAVVGDGHRGREGNAVADVRDQRRRRGAPGIAAPRGRFDQCSLLRLSADRSAARGVGDRRHPPRPAEARASDGSACRRRRTPSSPPADPCSRRSTPEPRFRGSLPSRAVACRCHPTTLLAFQGALQRLSDDPSARRAMAAAGRRWVEQAASPAAVAQAYVDLIVELNHRR